MMLAWSLTVHKVQGLSLRQIDVNFLKTKEFQFWENICCFKQSHFT